MLLVSEFQIPGLKKRLRKFTLRNYKRDVESAISVIIAAFVVLLIIIGMIAIYGLTISNPQKSLEFDRSGSNPFSNFIFYLQVSRRHLSSYLQF